MSEEKKKRKISDILTIIVGVALIATVVWSFTKAPGEQAPSISGTSPDNKPMSFSYGGKVTLVEFWFPSCPSCIREMPKIVKLHDSYNNPKFQVVSISLTSNTPEEVIRFQKTNNMKFPVIYDYGNKLAKEFDVKFTPTYLLVDDKGTIIHKKVGSLDTVMLKTLIERNIDKLEGHGGKTAKSTSLAPQT